MKEKRANNRLGPKSLVWSLKTLRDRCTDDAGCWSWAGYVGPQGYPVSFIDGKHSVLVRRHAMKLAGRLLSPMLVVDTCGNRLCCNPAHLQMATRKTVAVKAWETRKPHDIAELRRQAIESGRAKLNLEQVREIRHSLQDCELGKKSALILELAEKHGVSRSAIRKIDAGVSWREPTHVNSVFNWRPAA